MGTAGEDVAVLKTYIDLGEKGASKISTASKAAKKLEEAGKTLNDFEQIMVKLTWVSKVSTVLQVASAGFAVVQIFLPIKSQEDLILEGVNELKSELAKLSAKVGAEFKKYEKKLKIELGKASLAPALEKVKTAHKKIEDIAEYRRRGAKSDDPNVIEAQKELRALSAGDMDSALNLIEAYTTGTLLENNILGLMYSDTYGDIRKVAPLGLYLSNYAIMALSAKTSIRILQEKYDDDFNIKPSWSDAKSAELTEVIARAPSTVETLKNIAKACKHWGRACLSGKKRTKNIKDYVNADLLDDQIANGLPLNAHAYEDSANRIVDNLSERWPWLNFTAIVYAPVGGFNNHAWLSKGGSRGVANLKRVDVQNGKVNIVIYFADRTLSFERKFKKYPLEDGKVVTHLDTWRCAAREFWNLVGFAEYSDGLKKLDEDEDLSSWTPYWMIYKYGLTGEDIKKSMSGQHVEQSKDYYWLSEHGWEGDMIWTARNKTYPEHTFEGRKLCVGVCSQNNVYLTIPVGKVVRGTGPPVTSYFAGIMSLRIMEDAVLEGWLMPE